MQSQTMKGCSRKGRNRLCAPGRLRWIKYLVATRQYAPAADAITSLSKEHARRRLQPSFLSSCRLRHSGNS